MFVLAAIAIFAVATAALLMLGRLPESFPTPSAKSVLDSYTNFSISLSLKAGIGSKNTAVSPLSVYIAMLMLTEGASGDTRDELFKALGIQDLDQARAWFANEIEKLSSISPPSQGTVANSIWMRDGFPVNRNYVSVLRKYYDAESYNFSSPKEAVLMINKWIDEKTRGMIKEALDELDEDTVIVLVNTVYLKLNWTVPFEGTIKHAFYGEKGEETGDFLHGVVPIRLLQENGYVAVMLGYKGTDLSFIAIMPKNETLEAFSSSLNTEKLLGIFDALSKQPQKKGELIMPKFDVDSGSLSLKNLLMSIGIKKAFSPADADLSNMVEPPAKGLYVEDVIHRARVKVTEQGTEAAAATAVVVVTSIAQSDVKVAIDRPFLFFIVDPSTNAVVFAGSITSLS